MKATKVLLGLTLMGLITVSEAPAQRKMVRPTSPSCSAAAQQEFDRAVALLHSFWFDASAQTFAAVTQMEPGCAMGYWGQAMATVFSPNPFVGTPTPKTLQDGCPIVERANAAGPKTQRERDYIAAVDSLCQDRGTADPRARGGAYAQAMERLVGAYPEDREAAIFYALALNITRGADRQDLRQPAQGRGDPRDGLRGAARSPRRGALPDPQLRLPADRRTAGSRRRAATPPSRPAAPHALHMPSHIFTRGRLWQDSIETNRASAAAAKDHFDQLHAMDYLAYAYLQAGQDLAAKRVLEDAGTIRKVTPEHFVTGYALAAIPARYTLERRRWAEAASLTLHPTDFPGDRFPSRRPC